MPRKDRAMMRQWMISAALLLVNLISTPALAEQPSRGEHSQTCGQAERGCAQQAQTRQGAARTARAANQQPPRPGDTVRGGRTLKTDEARHLPRAPAGQAYRVVEDRVVLVDSGSMAIVQVLGLASALAN